MEGHSSHRRDRRTRTDGMRRRRQRLGRRIRGRIGRHAHSRCDPRADDFRPGGLRVGQPRSVLPGGVRHSPPRHPRGNDRALVGDRVVVQRRQHRAHPHSARRCHLQRRFSAGLRGRRRHHGALEERHRPRRRLLPQRRHHRSPRRADRRPHAQRPRPGTAELPHPDRGYRGGLRVARERRPGYDPGGDRVRMFSTPPRPSPRRRTCTRRTRTTGTPTRSTTTA